MKNLIILMLIAILGTAFAQPMIINTNTYHNVIVDNNDKLLSLKGSAVNYSFIFNKHEVRIIKNFTGDIETDIYEIKKYKVVSGIVFIDTNNGENITVNFDEEYIIISQSKTQYECYYIEEEMPDNIYCQNE